MPGPVDLTCVIHCHSTYSDGTGTVPQIAAAARRAGADAVLLTDHDTLAAKERGEERWHGSVLVCVGEEVTPSGGNHYLAFGLDETVSRHLPPAEIVAAVRDAGGFGFLAHPFSTGSERFRRGGMPWKELDVGATGIELWSWVTDTAERFESLADAARFLLAPGRTVDRPPRENLAAWDRLTAKRPVVAIGGIDAHQIGWRVGGRVPLRLMSYARSFSHLRTHVLLEQPPAGDTARDRDAIYSALRAGRCYLAVDSLAPARGFAFWAGGAERAEMGAEAPFGEGLELHVRLPRPATVALLRGGERVAEAHGVALDHRPDRPGAWRVETTLRAHGRERAWVLSNPIYLR